MTTDASQLVYTALKEKLRLSGPQASIITAALHFCQERSTEFQTYAGDYGKRTLATALDQICANQE